MKKKRKHPGRPPLPEKNKRTERVTIRLTQKEFAKLRAQAIYASKPIADLAREKITKS